MIGPLSFVDTYLLTALYSFRSDAGVMFFIGVTEIGEAKILAGFTLLIALSLLLYRRYVDIAGLVASSAGAAAAIVLLKYAIHRPRPELYYQAYPEGAFLSFPSAHAGLSMAVFGFLMYLLLQTAPSTTKRILFAILPTLITLIAFSRLYLGVHYLSDVLAGLAIGLFFVWVGIRVRLWALTKLNSRAV